MSLHSALKTWLTPVIDNEVVGGELWWSVLAPGANINDVDVCVVPIPGAGGNYVVGKSDFSHVSDGVTHDSGVRSLNTGLMFLSRGKKVSAGEEIDFWNLKAFEVLNNIMWRMLMLRDGAEIEDQRIDLIRLTNPPASYQQSRDERFVYQLIMELEHKPLREKD